MIVSPGDSSTPANIDPIITVSAPAAIALTISPVYLIPPSAITGTPVPSRAKATSLIAVNCGTPTPAIILVVQIDPGPIPTLTASAPASTKYFAASAVAIFPTITSSFGYFCLTSFYFVTTPSVCPCAVSITTASTPASYKDSTRCIVSFVTPTAAATLNLPNESLQELGYCLTLIISL